MSRAVAAIESLGDSEAKGLQEFQQAAQTLYNNAEAATKAVEQYKNEQAKKRLEEERKARKELDKFFFTSLAGAQVQAIKAAEGLGGKLKEALNPKNIGRTALGLLGKAGAVSTNKNAVHKEDGKLDFGKSLKNNLTEAVQNGVEKLGNKLSQAWENLGANIKKYADQFSSYQSKWNARLQGTNKTFQSIENLNKKNLSISPFVTQEAYLQNVDKAVEEGIAYNIEQRAFLQSIKDKIAGTFDAFDSSLLRIIRIQQADSTQARLGMEAYLTKFLNNRYQDTSYLKNNASNVRSALTGVSSNLSRNDAVELEFVVQKWLGSLGSVGVSDSTIQSLASGINSLGTGNVSALTGSGLQNLLVMGANRAGISYADMLTKGIKGNAANALMKGVVTYLQEIAGTDNQVIKSTYANIFGTTVEDLNAILNLVNDINDITKETLTYSGAVVELGSQMRSIPSRMHLGEMLSNLTSNATGGIAKNIANNPGLYATWVINDLIEQASGGINIPFISALGTGADLNANVNQIVKLGIVGIGALGQIGNIIGGLGSVGGLNLASWGYEDTTSRGTGFRGIKSGAQVGSSQMTYVGSSSGSDMYRASLFSAYDDAEENAAIMGTKAEDDITPAIVEHIKPDVADIASHMVNLDDSVTKILSLLQARFRNFTWGLGDDGRAPDDI